MAADYIEVSTDHLAEVLAENIRLRERVSELLEHGNRMLLQVRGVRYQVREFRDRMGFPNPGRPSVPDEATRRLAALIVLEESMELLSAMVPKAAGIFHTARSVCTTYINGQLGEPSLKKIAREAADLDYVVEGARQAYGIDGGPVAVAVHLANMQKDPSVRDETGKVIKPPGFVPPDEEIERALREQGAG